MFTLNLIKDIYPIVDTAIFKIEGKKWFYPNVELTEDDVQTQGLSKNIKNDECKPMKIQYYGFIDENENIIETKILQEMRIYNLDNIEDYNVFKYTFIELEEVKGQKVPLIKTQSWRSMDDKSLAELQVQVFDELDNKKKKVNPNVKLYTLKELNKIM